MFCALDRLPQDHRISFHHLFEGRREGSRLFRDVLGLPSVDAGHGWLIFRAPPSEVALHPTGGEGSQELYLMCDDLEKTIHELEEKGVSCS